MPTKEEDFKLRFSAIVAEMQEDATGPGQGLLVGSLAHQIVSHARRPNWKVFKAGLGRADYDALLQSFRNQGNALARQGAFTQMRAIETLACSLIARTQRRDPEVARDNRLLDGLIDEAIKRYAESLTAAPVIS
jgi:hypothetical protein